jgi:hypothetical protein
MSHQINFFITPKDTELLERKFRNIGPMLILHRISDSDKPKVIDSFGFVNQTTTWLYFYLVRPEDLGSVLMIHVPEQGHWVVDGLFSPTIEFYQSFFDYKVLRRGRIFYDDGYYQRDGKWADKNTAFIRWAKSIFSITRKSLKKNSSGYFMGDHAQKWVDTTNGKVDR